MSGWDAPSAANEPSSWNSPNKTAGDAVLANELQGQEYKDPGFAGINDRFPQNSFLPRPRKDREYGMYLVSSLIAQSACRQLIVEPDPEPTMTSDEAWAALVSADQEKDLDDFKVFFLEYVRNNKSLTFVDLEKKFRDEGLGVYLIAMVSNAIPALILGKRDPSTKNDSRSPGGNRKEVSRLLPTRP